MGLGDHDVVVIGAGVIGLTCAVSLAEAGARVRVLAESIPGVTSTAAGALWGPYLVEPKERVRAWALESFAAFRVLAAGNTPGVKMTAGVDASRTAGPPPDFADMVPGLQAVAAPELPAGFAQGVRYVAPLVDMPAYLAYLRQRLHDAGGTDSTIIVDTLTSVVGLAPIVVNCTGIGARHFVPDSGVFPIRGQLVVLDNPGIDEWFSEDTGESPDLLHWYPHGDALVLGGVAQPGDWGVVPDPATAAAIIHRCAAVEPRIAAAKILAHRAGLRPTRPAVRLDVQNIPGCRVVHCYGHGGAGVTLSWGCAAEVRSLAANLTYK